MSLAEKWRTIRQRFDSDGLIGHSLLVMLISNVTSVANMFFQGVSGRLLTAEEYGVLAAMNSLFLITVAPMAAIQNTLAHACRTLEQNGNRSAVRPLVYAWLRRLVVTAVIAFSLAYVFRNQAASFFHLSTPQPFVVCCMLLCFVLIIPVFSGSLQGLQHFVWMSASVNFWGWVRLILGWFLLLHVGKTASVVLGSQAVGVFIGLFIAGYGLWYVTAAASRDAKDKPKAVEDVPYFLLVLVTLTSFALLLHSDNMLVKHYFPDVAHYGPYSKASTIARTLIFLPQPIILALFPKVVAQGRMGHEHMKTLRRAVGFNLFITLGGLAACLLLPWIPLRLLYGNAADTPELRLLVRQVLLAMAPLGLAQMLLQFEMAQRRFLCLLPAVFAAAVYLTTVFFFHESLPQVMLALGCSALLALTMFASVVLLQVRTLRRSG